MTDVAGAHRRLGQGIRRAYEHELPALTQALAPIAPAPNERIVHTMGEAVSEMTALRRFNAVLMSVFGLAHL